MEINSLTPQQEPHFQHKRDVNSTLWLSNIAGNQDQHAQDPDFYQHTDASGISLTSGGQKSSQISVCGKGQSQTPIKTEVKKRKWG